jgi:hypothetical protein
MPRLQRFLVPGALGALSWLGALSCGSGNRLCPDTGSAQFSGLPCDIYSAAHTACVAAFSTTRALYKSYSGPLYQVTRKSDMTTAAVGVLSDGYANAAAQDGFCARTTCTITKIFDQSPHHNDLVVAGAGVDRKGDGPGGEDLPAVADSLTVTAGGHKVYGVYMPAGTGYRNDDTTSIAVNGQPQGVYMVASGTHVNNQCCFDFGNAETNNHDNGAGHMDAINLRCDAQGNLYTGLDMENGTYPPFAVANGIPFVTAMGINDGQHNYAVYWGNAQAECLTTSGLLNLPTAGYSPMHQEGAIILGIGGDNSNWAVGSFFEGAMTAGVPSNASMVAVQANVVSVDYAAVPTP